MKRCIVLLYLTVLTELVIECAKSEISLFQSWTSHNTKRPTSGYLERKEAATRLQCARQCKKTTECASAFYSYDDSICQLNPTAIDIKVYTGATENVLSGEYLQLMETATATSTPSPTITTNAATTTTNAPTTTASHAFNCSGISDNWMLARPSNGPDFSVKLYHLGHYDAPTAKATCAIDGARLPKITTLDKLELYRTDILQCPGAYSGCYGFWAEGSNTMSGVWSWTTDDLTPIPMSQGEGEFWAPGRPNYGNAAQCLWLGISSPYDYRFDDIDCNWASWTMCTICEKDVLV